MHAAVLGAAVEAVHDDVNLPAAGVYRVPRPGEVLGKLVPVQAEAPLSSYRCLPFPGGCEHLMHMCAVMAYEDFGGNRTCLEYGLNLTQAFGQCREQSFRRGPDAAIAEGGGFQGCFTAAMPSMQCSQVCADLAKADAQLANECMRSCDTMASCFGGCGVEANQSTPISECVGECMGPVRPFIDRSADFKINDCNTTQCEWLKMAATSWDNAGFHMHVATDDADHMHAATRTLYDLNRAQTTQPPVPPTPFPWGKLEARLVDNGADPFAAFSPPTALPPPEALAPLGEVLSS